MITSVSKEEYRKKFTLNHHFFISDNFLETVSHKVDTLLYLISSHKSCRIGLIVGVKETTLLSPFSAPFGGFHYKHEQITAQEISSFFEQLVLFLSTSSFRSLVVTLPPDIYQKNMNAKFVSCALQHSFKIETPDITSWVNLCDFTQFTTKSAREAYRKSCRNQLTFHQVYTPETQKQAINVIKKNRSRKGRPMWLQYEDLVKVEQHTIIDYFIVKDTKNITVASAILYRSHPTIVLPILWGDIDNVSDLRAMDYLAYNLYEHYKTLGYTYFDYGKSTEETVVNSGLLHFKESHNAISSLRYTIVWKNTNAS